MSISYRIKELRGRTNISQADLARAIGSSPGNVGEWERGRTKPGADALVALSSFFQVSIDWLLMGDELLYTPAPSEQNDYDQEAILIMQKFQRLSERDKGRVEGYMDAILLHYPNGHNGIR